MARALTANIFLMNTSFIDMLIKRLIPVIKIETAGMIKKNQKVLSCSVPTGFP